MIRPNDQNSDNEEFQKLAALLERSIHDLNNAATILEMRNQIKISGLVFEAVSLLMEARAELGEIL